MTREEAIRRIKAWNLDADDMEVLSEVIPELKEESEDERTKKAILSALRGGINTEKYLEKHGTNYGEVEAWLEKQKEQKPSISIDQLKSLMLQYLQEAANEKNDSDIEADTDKWARKILGYNFEQKPAEVDEYKIIKKHITEDSLSSKVNKRLTECGWYVTDEKPKEWSEEDELTIADLINYFEGDALKCSTEEMVQRIKSLRHQPRQEWSEEDNRNYEYLHQVICNYINNPQIEYKEREKASKELIPFWERLKFLRLQPKVEWSEEDEKMRTKILEALDAYADHVQYTGFCVNSELIRNELMGWLKSLQPQAKQEQKHYWKPTETDVALFNKAVTTNKALTPAERAQLDIIRAKFGYCRATNCSGIVQPEQKPETKLTGWVARDEDERIWVYETCPKRYSDWQQWVGNDGSMRLDQESFPNIKWEDEPMKVEITIRKK